MKERLVLPLKRKWFMMIKNGEKLEEYREIKPYWQKRLNKQYSEIEFTLGYPAKNDYSRRIVFDNPKIKIGQGKKDWGAQSGKDYFVITWNPKTAKQIKIDEFERRQLSLF